MMRKPLIAILIATAGLTACSVNPVTGERNFQLYGAEWEREVGAQMYAPMKQSQGGEHLFEIGIRGAPRQIAYIDSHAFQILQISNVARYPPYNQRAYLSYRMQMHNVYVSPPPLQA